MSGAEQAQSRPPAGVGDRLGPRYPGNLAFGDQRRVPTNYGTIRLDCETLHRHWNGAEQEIVEGHWEAECPCCYEEHTVDGFTHTERVQLRDLVLECCEEVRWLPPSDWIEDCEVCGHDHRERHGCKPPAYREPFPDTDQPATCTECEWSIDRLEDVPTHDGSCPECESTAVKLGDHD